MPSCYEIYVVRCKGDFSRYELVTHDRHAAALAGAQAWLAEERREGRAPRGRVVCVPVRDRKAA